MTTQAQIDANKQNSERSTGPRTEGGKGRSRLNGLKHGMRAKTPVMPWESEEEWQAHQSGWLQELAPKGKLETFYAEMTILTAWKTMRASRLEILLSSLVAPQPDTNTPPEPDLVLFDSQDEDAILKEMRAFAESVGKSPLQRYETSMSRLMNSNLAQLRLLQKDRAKAEQAANKPAPQPAPTPRPAPPPKPPRPGSQEEFDAVEAQINKLVEDDFYRQKASDMAAVEEEDAAEAEGRPFDDAKFDANYLKQCENLGVPPTAKFEWNF